MTSMFPTAYMLVSPDGKGTITFLDACRRISAASKADGKDFVVSHFQDLFVYEPSVPVNHATTKLVEEFRPYAKKYSPDFEIVETPMYSVHKEAASNTIS